MASLHRKWRAIWHIDSIIGCFQCHIVVTIKESSSTLVRTRSTFKNRSAISSTDHYLIALYNVGIVMGDSSDAIFKGYEGERQTPPNRPAKSNRDLVLCDIDELLGIRSLPV